MGDDRRSRDEGELELTTAELVQRPAAERDRPPADEVEPGPAADTRAEAGAEPERAAPLFPAEETESLRGRWTDVQSGFVDHPRRAVEEADSLVATAINRLAETFADERARLEAQWDRGDPVDTEALRQALRRYRSFFDRILSVRVPPG